LHFIQALIRLFLFKWEKAIVAQRLPRLPACCLAEAIGTFILVFFGCGAVHAAVLTGSQVGLWQVAIVWGVAVMLAVYVVGGVSGAHINPAITVSLAAWGRFSWRQVGPYILSQLAGAMLAAVLLFGLFHGFLAEKEREKNVERGKPGSDITAMCYGEYFPNPGPLAGKDEPYYHEKRAQFDALVPWPTAIGAEVLGTLLLALVVFAVTDPRNEAAPAARLGPVFIGLTVAVLISVIAPLTQACFNPARDFGPRLVAYFAGWGEIAIPGPRGGFFTVYILAPTLGAVAGGAVYLGLIRPGLPEPSLPEPENKP
jgi:glycerol uptake facilitator protein